jgi:peptidoglycan-associated lipoprotein
MNPISRWFSAACLPSLLLCVACTSTPAANPTPPPMDPKPVSQSEKGVDLAVDGPGIEALGPIYFDTDRSLLRPDARTALKKHAEAIKKHPEWGVVTIEGHCDERGSEEYNMGLGIRRASAVVRYLADLGVPSSRLQTRSLGEEHPAVAGHDESAWSRNRRSEIRSEAYDAAQR